jgi:hypothetical protein
MIDFAIRMFNKYLRDKIVLRPIAMFFDKPVSCLKLLRDFYVKRKERDAEVVGHFICIAQRERNTVRTIIGQNNTDSLDRHFRRAFPVGQRGSFLDVIIGFAVRSQI